MTPLICLLIIPAFLVSLPGTWLIRRLGRRMGHLDGSGSSGHTKSEIRHVPNVGGIAIMAGILVPILFGLALVNVVDLPALTDSFQPLEVYLPGIHERTPMILGLLGGLLVLHIMGLIDDRRPLGPWSKLIVQALIAGSLATAFDTRLLTMLDGVPGLSAIAPWPSILVTVAWLIVITNAINFLDNADGLSGGVSIIMAAVLLAAACLNEQWFIAAVLALMIGSVLGFLCFNLPPASIFMGDGGSLILGFLFGFLTIRITYYGEDPNTGWYGVFMPLIILAVPIYDFISVIVIRLCQGRNPLVGDQQHFSHRLLQRGLTAWETLAVIYGFTLVTGLGGVGLARLEGWQALLVGVQTFVILLVLGLYERGSHASREADR